jgi:butyrate kinase
MSCYILVINPGSTSTKIAVFDGEREVFRKPLTLQENHLDLPLFPEQ